MIIIWLILLLGVTRYIDLRGGRQIPIPPPHLKPTRKEEIVNYHLSMGEEISEVELNSILKNKKDDSRI